MAPNSVDDQYEGCREKMANLVVKKYLKKEFKDASKKDNKNATPPEDNLTSDHLSAIYIYTGNHVYNKFTNAVRNEKQNYKDKTFEWYSLHFFLTDAIQILNKAQNACISTFRGTNVKFNLDVLNKDVRFGTFTSSSLDRAVAKGFGKVSCFEIITCEGANITKYSNYPGEKEVLIPPYETFNIINVTNRTDENNLWCNTVYTLESTGAKSDRNCALFNKPIKAFFKKRLQQLKHFICRLFPWMTICK
uniref:NAD(P)(+)--arginine ADP-ribosyltransferase n=1 Tax=Sinocyclocheilus grahami TaxID=75366 RepID=A0A672LN98_SINGR